jgi:3-oxoacyl-[acyl-carrier protein] reductase
VATLEGKAALVTGGSRGIGRAIVKRLAADGASVVFSYLSRHDAAQSLVAEVTGDGGQAYAVQADQGSLADLRRLTAEVQQRCGGLDIVVINAASGVGQLIEEVTEESYDAYMAVHAKGPFFLIQYAGRTLRDGGRIISISSLNTRLHPPGGALYTAAKGALEHATTVAAIEFGGRGITANIVSPGAAETELLRAANPGETFEDEVAQTALKRLGQPEDIARVVAFLAGPDSGWISGQKLAADGGMMPLWWSDEHPAGVDSRGLRRPRARPRRRRLLGRARPGSRRRARGRPPSGAADRLPGRGGGRPGPKPARSGRPDLRPRGHLASRRPRAYLTWRPRCRSTEICRTILPSCPVHTCACDYRSLTDPGIVGGAVTDCHTTESRSGHGRTRDGP